MSAHKDESSPPGAAGEKVVKQGEEDEEEEEDILVLNTSGQLESSEEEEKTSGGGEPEAAPPESAQAGPNPPKCEGQTAGVKRPAAYDEDLSPVKVRKPGEQSQRPAMSTSRSARFDSMQELTLSASGAANSFSPRKLTLRERLNTRSRKPVRVFSGGGEGDTGGASPRNVDHEDFSSSSTDVAANKSNFPGFVSAYGRRPTIARVAQSNVQNGSFISSSPVPTSSYLANPKGLSLKDRLNVRSRAPELLYETHEDGALSSAASEEGSCCSYSSPPRANSNSPPPFIEDSPTAAKADDTLSQLTRFSPISTSSDLNSSMASSAEGEGEEEEDQGAERHEPPGVEELDTTLVDAVTAEQREEEVEPMDWEDIDPNLLVELQSCRKELKDNNDEGQSGTLTHLNFPVRDSPQKLFLVVDTNVFIAQLPQLRKLTDPSSAYVNNVTMYLPWAVLRELDNLKSRPGQSAGGEQLRKNARAAIDFVHGLLTSKNPMVCGQTGKEEREAEKFAAHNNDDRILQACLMLRSEGKHVILNTNDKNLANKARISHLEAFSSAGLIAGLQKALDELAKALQTRVRRILDQPMMTNPRQLTAAQRLPNISPDHETNVEMDRVHEVFEKVWRCIFVYAWQYCRAVGFNWSLSQEPEGTDRTQFEVTVDDCRACLKHFHQAVVKLHIDLTNVLRKPPVALSVIDPALIAFHESLTQFLVNLPSRGIPLTHPQLPSHQNVDHKALLNYLWQPVTREKANIGLSQLLELRRMVQGAFTHLRSG